MADDAYFPPTAYAAWGYSTSTASASLAPAPIPTPAAAPAPIPTPTLLVDAAGAVDAAAETPLKTKRGGTDRKQNTIADPESKRKNGSINNR